MGTAVNDSLEENIVTAQGRHRRLALALIIVLALSSPALAADVQPLFDLSTSSGGPFPSDRFTVFDTTQNTWLRVNLPKPDCVAWPSDCADLDVINTLDGFNLRSRLRAGCARGNVVEDF